MAVTKQEYDQATRESSDAVVRWELFVAQDPARLVVVEPADATAEQRAAILEPARTNMLHITEALAAAEKLLAMANDYHLNNGPRLGRRARAAKAVQSCNALIASLGRALATFTRMYQAFATE